jgi:hypothetical protein
LTLVLLDTNTYLRLAKRIRPLLGVKFGQKDYVLTVLRDVEDEVRRSPKLRFQHPWFEEPVLGAERDAKQVRLNADEKRQLDIARSVLRAHVLAAVDLYTTGGRQPPSDTDCRVLAFGQIREAVVVTDDLGMHQLAGDFELPIWHGWELLAKMRSAKKVDNDLIREIYDALERNGDLTATWRDAKHTEFVKIFGLRRV